MKRLYFIVGTVGLLLLGSLFPTSSSSQASKSFFSFCFKVHRTAKDNGPTNIILPNPNGSCSTGFSISNESSPSQLISDMNLLSKGMFNQGWAVGHYQTSVQDQSQPCIPGQPGCSH